jgi:hypothetical protein
MDESTDQTTEVRNRVRPKIRPKSRETRFKKLRSLVCFSEVHQKLKDGYSTIEVARFIQQEKAEYLGTSEKGLASLLRQYRDTIPAADMLSDRPIPAVRKALTKLNEGMDEVTELEKLHNLQQKRIQIDYKLEKKVGKLLAGTNYEIRLDKDILKDSAAIKMDLGINQRHLGQLDIEANLTAEVMGRYNNEAVAKVVSDPESRRKVLSVAEKFVALAAKLGSTPMNVRDISGSKVVEGEVIEAEASTIDVEPEGTK